jgi:hypothetical protein
MTLAAARLESDMRTYLILHNVKVSADATMGGLATRLKESGLVSDNGAAILRGLKTQRNYLTHGLYDLFAARIDEGLMFREELEDLSLLAERAWVLEENLTGVAETAEQRIDQLQRGECAHGTLLITP